MDPPALHASGALDGRTYSTIADCKKVARYVDMPLQHIHENMLERMRRETSQQYIVDLIKRIRAGVPGIALRTTFIVGFPGETEASFQALLDFIRETKFERLGVFAYSKEDGTRAGAMAGQLADKVKQKRRELAMAAQHKVAAQISESFVGREIKILVEGPADEKQLQSANVSSWEHGLVREAETKISKLKTQNYLVGRGEADAPDIDGRVYVRGNLPVGEFARVKIIGHTDYDLIAEPVLIRSTGRLFPLSGGFWVWRRRWRWPAAPKSRVPVAVPKCPAALRDTPSSSLCLSFRR